jgi:hypothetical protein
MRSQITFEHPLVYRSRKRQWLIAAGMLGLFVLLWSQTQQPDYETHVKPAFSRYIWELLPFLVLSIVMAIRAFRVRTVTTADGIHLYRVLAHEYYPWSAIAGVELHPSPSGKIATIKLRRTDRRTVKVSNFWTGKSHRSEAAEQLAVQLRNDYEARLDGRVPASPPAGGRVRPAEASGGR